MRRRIATCAFLLAVLAPAAWGMELTRGSTLLEFGVGNGTADLTVPAGAAGYITGIQVPEIRVQASYMRMMADDYAFSLSGAYGFYSETDKPGNAATGGSPDLKTTVSAYSARVGGDRVAKVGERATLFFGPGVEWWSGKYKFEAGSSSDESARTNRFSLGARIGGILWVGKNVGLLGHIGHKIGMASAEKDGAKATWWPASTDGSGGVVLLFGGAR